jgi:cytoskeleton protein RodZ
MSASEESGAPPAPPPAPASLGEKLRGARLTQDLTIEQLATELRIEAKHLNALESDHFEQIGVPVFVKGYLKQYGSRLGLDVRDLLGLYYDQTTLKDVQIQPSRTIKLRDERQITSWILAAVALATVAVGLAAWWWSGGSLRLAPSTPSPAAATLPAEEPRPTEQERPTAPPPVAPREALPAADSSASPAVEPGEETRADAPAVAAVDEGAGADDARAAPVVAVPLEFTFESESWAEVTDARGERLLFGLNAAGRNVTVRGEPPFAIVLGDANAVRLAVDGAPYEIPRAGRQGNLVRFSVDLAEE